MSGDLVDLPGAAGAHVDNPEVLWVHCWRDRKDKVAVNDAGDLCTEAETCGFASVVKGKVFGPCPWSAAGKAERDARWEGSIMFACSSDFDLDGPKHDPVISVYRDGEWRDVPHETCPHCGGEL